MSLDPAALPSLALAELPRRAFVEQVMGLPFSLHVRGPRARGAEVEAFAGLMFEQLRGDDRRFSLWKPESEVSRIRRGEVRLEDADQDVRVVAGLCREAEVLTGGAFSAWFTPHDSSFDPTGLVKGWAAQRAFEGFRERLRGLGAHDALLSAGGDVVVACERTDTPDWMIGVEDPRDRSHLLHTFGLRCGAVATSGTAARGAHLLDPSTGAPATSGVLSATVIGPELTWADVYATAAFVGGRATADRIEALGDHAVILVTDQA